MLHFPPTENSSSEEQFCKLNVKYLDLLSTPIITVATHTRLFCDKCDDEYND